MPDRAHLISLEALESFRASLVVYQSKARPALEEVTAEVLRTRSWLQHDQRLQLDHLKRRHTAKLEQARLALSNARISHPHGPADDELMAVRIAQRALDQVEEKIKRLKYWSRDFDQEVEPVARQLDHLLHILTTDLSQAVSHLAQTIRTLTDYAGLPPLTPTNSPAGHGSPDATDQP